jgi:hypothetical protein
MQKRQQEVAVQRAADEVWRFLSDPCSITEWIPGVASCITDGERRCTTLEGVGELTETFSIDPASRTFSYSIVEAPFDLTEHHARITVTPEDGGRSVIRYETEVGPDVLADLFEASMRQALQTLRGLLEGVVGP